MGLRRPGRPPAGGGRRQDSQRQAGRHAHLREHGPGRMGRRRPAQRNQHPHGGKIPGIGHPLRPALGHCPARSGVLGEGRELGGQPLGEARHGLCGDGALGRRMDLPAAFRGREGLEAGLGGTAREDSARQARGRHRAGGVEVLGLGRTLDQHLARRRVYAGRRAARGSLLFHAGRVDPFGVPRIGHTLPRDGGPLPVRRRGRGLLQL